MNYTMSLFHGRDHAGRRDVRQVSAVPAMSCAFLGLGHRVCWGAGEMVPNPGAESWVPIRTSQVLLSLGSLWSLFLWVFLSVLIYRVGQTKSHWWFIWSNCIVFSQCAVTVLGTCSLLVLDTPGHVCTWWSAGCFYSLAIYLRELTKTTLWFLRQIVVHILFTSTTPKIWYTPLCWQLG